MQNFLISNMQKWTPLSIIISLAVTGLTVVIVWDTINGQALPPYVVGLLSFLLGGTVTTQSINHGNNLALSNTSSSTDQIAHAAATSAAVTAQAMSEHVATGGETHAS